MAKVFIPRRNTGQIAGVECAANDKQAEEMAEQSLGRNPAVLVRVDGGWMAWDNSDEWYIWNRQK